MLQGIAMNRVTLILFVAVSFCALACSNGRTSTDGEEILRVTSPDGRVDAVLIEVPTGATVPTPTELYVTPKGSKPVTGDLVLRADHVDKAGVTWDSERLLAFSYESARIYRFSNVWRSRAVDNHAYQVEITLKPMSVRSVR
jgi:hypothetical protein